MASLPSPKTVTYEEWLRMPEAQDAISVQVPVSGIWPD